MQQAETLHLHSFRNDEHFQFMTEVISHTKESKPVDLKISVQFAKISELFALEDVALKKINKSAFTQEINEADKKRDAIFRGMVLSNDAAMLKVFKPAVVKAATNLKIVFDTYGNVTKKPLNEETSAITNLLQDLKGKYAPDVAAVGIGDWTAELDKNNKEFEKLVQDRYDEAFLKTDLVLKECRINVDAAYHELIKRIYALELLEEDKNQKQKYSAYMKKLNIIAEKYHNIIAQRHGRKTKSENADEHKNELTVNE